MVIRGLEAMDQVAEGMRAALLDGLVQFFQPGIAGFALKSGGEKEQKKISISSNQNSDRF